MKVLWFGNSYITQVSDIDSRFGTSGISWISSIVDDLLVSYDIEIVYAFPQSEMREIMTGSKGNFSFYGLYKKKAAPWKHDVKFREESFKLINEIHPDIIQVWGTEYAHSLDFYEAVEQAGMADKTIIYIQGLVSFLGEKYYASLPLKVCARWTFRDFVRQDNIAQQRKKFLKRGKNEIELLKKAKNVAGRTLLDYAHVKQINFGINYYNYNESMRESFFKKQWSYEKCEKNSIFITQGYYPIKGLHFLVKAVGTLKQSGVNVRVYVAGLSCLHSGINLLREPSYGRYIRKLMIKNNVVDNFEFLGVLTADQVADRLEKANLFVMPSAMENSPNSLAEALVVGTPVVAAYSGGIPDMVQNGINGLTYQHDDDVVLASCILRLLSDPQLCTGLSEEGRNKARTNYAALNNNKKLYSIYEELSR